MSTEWIANEELRPYVEELEEEIDRLAGNHAAYVEVARENARLREKVEKMAASALANESQLQDELARLREIVKTGFAAQERADYQAIETLKAENARLRESNDPTDDRVHFPQARIDFLEAELDKLREENEALRKERLGKLMTEPSVLELARLREDLEYVTQVDSEQATREHRENSKLKAENARLRESLEKIANMGLIGERVPQGFSTASDIARNALKETT